LIVFLIMMFFMAAVVVCVAIVPGAPYAWDFDCGHWFTLGRRSRGLVVAIEIEPAFVVFWWISFVSFAGCAACFAMILVIGAISGLVVCVRGKTAVFHSSRRRTVAASCIVAVLGVSLLLGFAAFILQGILGIRANTDNSMLVPRGTDPYSF
jgi:hypothetical protein